MPGMDGEQTARAIERPAVRTSNHHLASMGQQRYCPPERWDAPDIYSNL
jgi:hypothetical protein